MKLFLATTAQNLKLIGVCRMVAPANRASRAQLAVSSKTLRSP
ncbi:hypothetical protein OMP43_19530 [Sphingomonas sp. CBMAI 2297]|nr:hypothetical protein [Sphingomonas sp. CBMAI 2297]MDH4746224.1 hypothetical protein [Sphingomonas sp. CBMAI 2297]